MTMRPASISWDTEWESRTRIDPKKVCSFGIKPLDDVLLGILKKDFIVIGADSGIGKSGLCLEIAVHNARQGKKVALYFIEGGDEEAIARIKWRLMTEKYFKNRMTGIDMNYRKWRMNMINTTAIHELEKKCFEEFKVVLDNLMLYSYNRGLTIKDFVDSLDYFFKPAEGFENDPLSYEHQVDLIIIDHLQYFTLANPSKELTEQSEILKKVNEICHGYKIPVILVSHLRKKEKDRGLPSQEDFYGTSNTPKMSSIAITMSGLPAINNGRTYPTYFRIVKSRTKISPHYAILCNFELTTGEYEKTYSVHKIVHDKPRAEALLKHELPEWAYNACTVADPRVVHEEQLYEGIKWEE